MKSYDEVLAGFSVRLGTSNRPAYYIGGRINGRPATLKVGPASRLGLADAKQKPSRPISVKGKPRIMQRRSYRTS